MTGCGGGRQTSLSMTRRGPSLAARGLERCRSGEAFGFSGCEGLVYRAQCVAGIHDAAVLKARELLAENLHRVTKHSSVDVDVKPEIDLMEIELIEIAEQEKANR